MSDRLKVAVILPELLPVPPVRGGAVEQWVHEISGHAPERVQLTIISRPADGGEAQRRPGVDYVGVPWTNLESRLQAFRSGRRGALSYLAKFAIVLAYAWRVRRHLADFDVVCVQNEPIVAALLPRVKGQRRILHMHNDHLNFPGIKALLTPMVDALSELIFVSRAMLNEAAKTFPQHVGKMTVILNGADPDLFRPADEATDAKSRSVLYVGRLDERKGVHVLVAAAAKLFPRFPDLKLTVVGASFFEGSAETPYQRRVVEEARALGDRIEFTGFVEHKKLPKLFQAATVVAVPSVWPDPCPLTVLEAMSSGAAVVGSRVGGIPELLGDDSGLLVQPDDATALAEGIERMLDDDKLREACGRAARGRVLDYLNWNRVAEDFYSSMEGRR